MFLFLFLSFSMLFNIWSFFRLKELFQVRNGLTTSLLCFLFCFVLENAKNLCRWETLNGEKKEDGLIINL